MENLRRVNLVPNTTEYLNDIIITTFKDVGHRMSYFNAAESTYSEEAEERNKCREEFRVAGQALIDAGLNPSDYVGDMLTSSHDYMPVRKIT